MYKVCFVDDELQNHKLLANIVKWQEMGFEIAGTATDGKMGVELFCAVRPDLMLIDIKMPIMNGIDCIKKIREISYEPKLILVTALSEFEYARQAILLSVEDYLLKPVNRQDINRVVLKVKQDFDAKNQLSQQLSDIKTALHEHWVSENMVQAISELKRTGEICQSVREKIENLLEMELDIVDIHLHTRDSSHMDSAQLKKLAESFFKDQSVYANLMVLGEPLRLVCLVEKNDHARLIDYGDFIPLFEQYGYLVTIYLYENPRSGTMTLPLLQALIDSPLRGFYRSHSTIGALLSPVQFQMSELDQADFRDVIARSIENNDYAILWELIEQTIAAAAEMSLHPQNLIGWCFDLLISLKLYIKNNLPFETFDMLRSICIEALYNIQKADLLKQYLKTILSQVFKQMETRSSTDPNQTLLLKADEYIDQNFHNPDLNVQNIADSIGLSKNYFLKIYKTAKGMTVWDEITRLRIQKAKMLIVHTNDTIGKIGEDIGYKSSYHFMRKFKEIVGKTPKQYRNERSKNNGG